MEQNNYLSNMEQETYDDSAENSSCTQNNSCQTHTHEFLGSTKLAEEGDERHNHRFAGVTSELIPVAGDNHVHEILVNTDFFDHNHEVGIRTGIAVDVGDGKHVHLAHGNTTMVDGHVHAFIFATLIQKPLLPPED